MIKLNCYVSFQNSFTCTHKRIESEQITIIIIAVVVVLLFASTVRSYMLYMWNYIEVLVCQYAQWII